VSILKLLQRADEPLIDQAAFFKCQILFWLIGATDGHGKNFSLFLRPEGRYGLTPFYDVLSAQPAFDQRQIPHGKYKLAMSVGRSRKYRINGIRGRHFVETGKEAGFGSIILKKVIADILEKAGTAPDQALVKMPEDFATDIHVSVKKAVDARLNLLEEAI
jgi:serine/threonine-protein kinase HipA